MDAPCRIRPAVPADIPAVADIEREAFTDAWSARSLAAYLDDLFLVAETDGVQGYAIVLHAGSEAELLNIAVARAARRRGIGRALLDAAVREAGRCGAETVFLEVRAANAEAQSLYAACRFVEVGRRRGYYRDPHEDALVLACTTGAPA